MLDIIKAHAYGNDFLYVPEDQVAGRNVSELARQLCERHTGAGADGLILYRLTAHGAAMRLINPDGSRAQVSGNGVRGVAAIAARGRRTPGARLAVRTDAGEKTLTLEGIDGPRYTFRAAMGAPRAIRQVDLPITGETVRAVALDVGNPQCVVLGPLPDERRFRTLGPAIERHPTFPERTNVSFADTDADGRVHILIWERGVGPTLASGTGACGAAVASASAGRAARVVDVVSPGGTQRVEWLDDGVYLTGWVELVLEGQWIGS